MARVSEAAIQHNRESSLARYHQNADQVKKAQKYHRDEKFRYREFIAWDGEGYNAWVLHDNDGYGPRGLLDGHWEHRYMLFGASTGDCITSSNLSTSECLELIVDVKRQYPDAYHIGFSFEYDVNMILRDLPWRMLAILKECGKCRYLDRRTGKRYRIQHVPHKWLRVSCEGISATIYDGFGFFHSKYTTALKKYGFGDDPRFEHITTGKSKRGHFAYADLAEVKAYWRDEISLYPPLMDKIRDAVYNGGYHISEWHGPGALAAYLLREVGASKWHSKKLPAEVKSAIRHAYAGGRFTGALCGLYLGDVYTADRNSAYIYACSYLPRMDAGRWVRQNSGDIDRENLQHFGLYHIEFDAGQETTNTAHARGVPEPPYPLFHRSANGVLRWPRKCNGWYWTPEVQLVACHSGTRFLEAWVYDDDGTRPFRFVNDAYARRLELQREGNPAEKAYKWALAAMYGAFARRVGWNRETRKAPPSHELAWAGYITSHCRAAVSDLGMVQWMKGNARGLITIDTDGVCSTVPFDEKDLPGGIGEELGQWKLEHWTGILQWQNGIYWLRDEDGNWTDPKSRGVPKGSIPFDVALKAYESMDFGKRPFVHPVLSVVRTHFIGYRQALQHQFTRWRKWITEPVYIMMGGNPSGKAFHFFAYCYACKWANRGRHIPSDDVRGMHTITNTAPDKESSHPHTLPWLEDQPYLPAGFKPDDFIVMDTDLEE
jgi:hypothetical protein